MSSPEDSAMPTETAPESARREAGPSEAPAAARGPPVTFVPPPPAPSALPVASGGVLDLTNSHLHSLDEVELDASLTELDLTCNRLKALDPRVLALPGLTSLSFRQNLLTDVSSIIELKSAAGLEQLIFHDNQLKQIPSLELFKSLNRLELSYNEFRSLKPLVELAEAPLTELFVASNKVTSFEGIAPLTKLEVLELGSNRLRKIEHIETLHKLRQLWLGRNRIDSLVSFPPLLNLTIIALPNNRLTSMKGLEACTELEELYLSYNGIEAMEGLEALTKLKVLDLAMNKIQAVGGLEKQTELTDLWLNDNQIPTFDGLAEALQNQRTSITCIYLERNPLAQNNAYKAILLDMLPKLEQLDSNDVIR